MGQSGSLLNPSWPALRGVAALVSISAWLSACGAKEDTGSAGGGGGMAGAGGEGGVALPPECTGEGEAASGAGGAGGTAGVGGGDEGPLTGVISLPGGVDATNASIDDGGVFRMSVFGCDFCWEYTYRWEAAGDTVVVQPPAGEEAMEWIGDVGVVVGVTEVRLTRGEGSAVLVEVTGADGSFAQDWQVGRVCEYCCGPDGPIGHGACGGPLPLDSCVAY
ncbi:hypothetical protein [Sorangium sp. So ce861]|uniref:hypothetical protein n=1 Tax=Sorangium sp. So ce861 TaxID=3133323 RepID=UPI003F61E96C